MNAKENRFIKKIIMILTIVILCSCGTKARATTSVKIEKNTKSNDISNYIEDVQNEEEASDTIRDLILTINSEGINRNFLSQILDLYVQLSENYTNDEIANMIESNKEEFEKNNVKMENVSSVINFLRSVKTEQLSNIIEQIDIDKIASKVENGATIQEILKDIMGNMTAAEKVNFVMDILLSAHSIKNILIVLVVIFVYRTLLRCVIYKKAGKRAWAPFIPIYRNIVMLNICGMSPWWLLLLFVPIIGWAILYVVSVSSKFMLAESFGKGTFFAFGLWLLSPIFETILVFSRKTKYIGFEE